MTTAADVAVPSNDELMITRVFDAPRDLVFRMWTDPRHAMHWWGPRDYPAVHMEIDARPGGKWRHCLRATEDGRNLWQNGIFRDIVVPERLVFTFAWEEDGERGLETLVTVTFVDEGGKTRVTFHHAPFQSVGERDGHQGGWTSGFDRLDEFLSRPGRVE
jgi:uncharacterized protein YndB with AHSA1/START domain